MYYAINNYIKLYNVPTYVIEISLTVSFKIIMIAGKINLLTYHQCIVSITQKKNVFFKFVFILLAPQRLIDDNNVPYRINDEILYVLKFIMKYNYCSYNISVYGDIKYARS